jgi:hypothetical protein
MKIIPLSNKSALLHCYSKVDNRWDCSSINTFLCVHLSLPYCDYNQKENIGCVRNQSRRQILKI